VKFFDNKGNHLRNLKIPNSDNVVDISWEGSGLRLSIGAGSNIYCASIKPNYKWCYLSNGTIVFGYQKSDRVDFCLVFWETKTDKKSLKYVKDLAEIKGEGEYCAVFSKIDDDATVQIDLCNSLGTTLETKFVSLDVISYNMSKTHIIVISENYVYLWHYRSQTSRLTMFEASSQASLRKIGREICWFIDEKPDLNIIYDKEQFDNTRECEDIICCVAANENVLIVGRESGVLQRFTLPHISEETKLFWKPLSAIIGINCDSTRLALVDISGTLNILEINSQGGNVLEF
jgi:WD repeat-containing protein 35